LTLDDQASVRIENSGHNDLGDAMFDLLLIVREGVGNSECEWVFYDRSRNEQGHWCEMARCGNRPKNRAFRARRR
jgi:predicted RNA-binding Zn ribbon-like protein